MQFNRSLMLALMITRMSDRAILKVLEKYLARV